VFKKIKKNKKNLNSGAKGNIGLIGIVGHIGIKGKKLNYFYYKLQIWIIVLSYGQKIYDLVYFIIN
jgi:hypothetical protein